MDFNFKVFWFLGFLSHFMFVFAYGKYSRPRGVSISRAVLYQAAENFTCFDGQKTIDFKYINDDYCDCADGSDEPGTSACPGGTFDCVNHGYHSVSIPSSQVNDGICDCCDGSDEFEKRHSRCVNRCFELGKKLRDTLEEQHRQLVFGHEMFKEYMKGGETVKKEAMTKLEQLDKEKTDLEKLLSELEALKIEAEKSEQEVNELYRQRHTDESADCAECDQSQQSDVIYDEAVTADRKLTSGVELEPDEDESLSTDEVESKRSVRDSSLSDVGIPDDERLDHNQQNEHRVSAAERARREFEEVSQNVIEISKEIDELQTLLRVVIPNQLFFLQSRCFDVSHDDYVYSLCPFHQIRRHSSTVNHSMLIGKWSSLLDDPFGTSVYDNGDLCSNGNNMSATVLLKCDASSEVIIDSVEDSCHFGFTLKTPAVCGVPPPAAIRDPFYEEL